MKTKLIFALLMMFLPAIIYAQRDTTMVRFNKIVLNSIFRKNLKNQIKQTEDDKFPDGSHGSYIDLQYSVTLKGGNQGFILVKKEDNCQQSDLSSCPIETYDIDWSDITYAESHFQNGTDVAQLILGGSFYYTSTADNQRHVARTATVLFPAVYSNNFDMVLRDLNRAIEAFRRLFYFEGYTNSQ